MSSQTPYTLTPSQYAKYQKVALSDYYLDPRLIEVGRLSLVQSNGKILISLPNFQCGDLLYSARQVDYTTDNDYSWYGEITSESDDPCNEGRITMMSVNGEKFGHILIDSVAYEYFDLGGNVQVLARVNDAKFTSAECGIDASTPDYSSQTDTTARSEPCVGQCETRIFVYYTQAALNAEINMNARIVLAIAQTNQAYLNSAVPLQDCHVVLAGSSLLTGFTETYHNTLQDVNTFAGRADVQATRNATQSDLMILLTNGDYGGVFGRVQAVGPNFSTSYGLVQVLAATSGRFTFSHEVAHLFGARHDSDPLGTFNHGHTFRPRGWLGIFPGKTRYTIMADLPANKSRIQHYSNPSVNYLNTATGVVNFRDNARQHRLAGCQVGNFFANPAPPLSCRIEGSDFVCACYAQTFEAIINCGTPPYHYQWSFSNDGVTYTNDGSDFDFYSHTMPCQGIDYVFIRVTVTDANNNSVTAMKVVRVVLPTSKLQPQPCAEGRQSKVIVNEKMEEPHEATLNLFPNPAQKNLQVEFISSQNGYGRFTLSNIKGKQLKTLKQLFSIGKNIVNLSISDLPQGSYCITVYTNETKISKTFIIAR